MSLDYSEELRQKLASLAPAHGCYLFKDGAGEVVYVGKAKSLKSRVRSYFQESGSDNRYFIPILRRVVADLETIVTASEKEAAVLENELIKRYQPRFNVKLRDDKDFLCLRLDRGADWPRLEMVRRPAPDGARYFGPYHSATSARRTLGLVNKHFQLRTCTDADLRSRRRPCLQYQIKRCPGPCVYPVDAALYGGQVRAVELFLDGRHDELSRELEERMRTASRGMEFELAALYRDQLRAVESIRQSQRVVTVHDLDQDVIGLFRQAEICEVVVLEVRGGRLTDSHSFSLRGSELPDEEVLAGFVGGYYGDELVSASELPDELLLPLAPDALQGLEDWLTERRGRKLTVLVPKRGQRAGLVRMAAENAAHAFAEKQRAQAEVEVRLEELREKLRLPTVPHYIECCDISHLGGGDAVGAIVCLRDGEPHKKRYKTFRVRTTESGDDYAAMYEVLARRFLRGRGAAEAPTASAEAPAASAEAPALRDAASAAPEPPAAPVERNAAANETWELPDLLVVDGGRGQLGVALAAAHDLGLHELCIVGLAKERESVTGEKIVDRVYLPGQKNGILLRPQSASLYLLARARDEAHRFANRGREQTGKKRRLRSELESVKGLGPAARRALLTTLGSLAAIRAASDAEILAVPGIQKRHLAALRRAFEAPGAGGS
ncbi:MAG: excinuclease ABC subunit UvrC [Polyangiaceae bacterium]|nr:excinuclease ABC subunit UvrC [Polyangiaceae bacterium]